MQQQEPAFKLKPFLFSSPDASNDEEAGPLHFRFGGDETDVTPISALFSVRSNPPAQYDAPQPSTGGLSSPAPGSSQPMSADQGTSISVSAVLPSKPPPVIATPTIEEHPPKRASGLFKNLQLASVQSASKPSMAPDIKRIAPPVSKVEPAVKKVAAEVVPAVPQAHHHAAQRLTSEPAVREVNMSDAPSISTVAAAPTVASAVPATPPAQHTTSIVPAPPTAMPPAAVMPALPDAALEASASLHEKRLNECTAMAKRLEEMMAGLGDCQERLAELLLQQACLNAEILVANSPQLADLARPVSEE